MILKDFGIDAKKIPAIGQGTGKGGPKARQAQYDSSYERLLRLGIERGMTLIDTAEEYGMGAAEEVVGRAIDGIRDKVFIATKLSSEHCSIQNVFEAAEQSLRRLKTDYIDLYQIHWPNPSIAIEETIGAMVTLVKQGKVRYLGICNVSPDMLKRANEVSGQTRIGAMQAEYNLFDRSPEDDFLPYCRENKISFFAYSPLDQGALVNGSGQRALIYELAEAYNKTPAQIVLRWLIGQESVFVIPHTDKEKHLIENAGAADFGISKEDMLRIDTICRTQKVRISAKDICVPWKKGQMNFQTQQDALQNKMKFIPSPAQLAESIRAGAKVKPVRVQKLARPNFGSPVYELLEGKLRYWASSLAFGEETEIQALVRE